MPRNNINAQSFLECIHEIFHQINFRSSALVQKVELLNHSSMKRPHDGQETNDHNAKESVQHKCCVHSNHIILFMKIHGNQPLAKS